MKRGLLIGVVFVMIFSLAGVFAEGCDLQVSMVNQDPYPAVPGEEVKVVFQVDGIESTECGQVEFELLEAYPITLGPGQQKSYSIDSGTFSRDYKAHFLAAYTLRVASNALNGDNAIEVQYRQGANLGYETKEFVLNVLDTQADFEVYVKEYDLKTRILTFEILNIDALDVEALTIEIPSQDNIVIRGANRNIVGDLDSNDYTTFDFVAIPSDGEIELTLYYSDSINERRTMTKKVAYESSYFTPMADEIPKTPVKNYIVAVAIVLLIGWWIFRRIKKKKAVQLKMRNKK